MNIIISTFSVKKPTLETQTKFIEEKVSKLPGVLQCKVNKDRRAYVVTYDSDLCIEEDINRIIENPELSSIDKMEYSVVSFLFIALFFILLYLLNLRFHHVNDLRTTLFILIIFIGSLSPFYQIRYDEEFKEISGFTKTLFNDTKISKSVSFHLGRVLGFTFIGLILGYLGSLIKFSTVLFQIFQILALAYILSLGLYICGVKVFKRLHRLLPIVTKLKINTGSNFLIGLKSCFIPTIPLQVMQILAASTGSARFGAAIMFVFTLAVIPNALSHQVITRTVGESRVAKSSAVTGLLILIMGLFILSSGLGAFPSVPNLRAFYNNQINKDSSHLSTVAVMESDLQTVNITIENDHFSPTIMYVKKNAPLRINFKYLGNNNDKRCFYFNSINSSYSFEGKTGSVVLPALSSDIIFSNWTGSHSGKIIVSDNPSLARLDASQDLLAFKSEQIRLQELLKKDRPLEKIIKIAELSPDHQSQTIVIESSHYSFSPFIIVAKPYIPMEMIFNLHNYNFLGSNMTIREAGSPTTVKTLVKSANFFNESVTFDSPGTYILYDQNTVAAIFHVKNYLRNVDLGSIKSRYLGPKSN